MTNSVMPIRISTSSRSITLALIIAIVATASQALGHNEVLTSTAEVLSQSYCENQGGETYQFSGRARIHFLNNGTRSLILDAAAGASLYQFAIAHDASALARGDYEYSPKFDWAVTVETARPTDSGQEKHNKDVKRSEQDSETGGPGIDFRILEPGQYFDVELPFGVEEIRLDNAGRLRPGMHVLQFSFETWGRPDLKFEDLRQKWLKFGDLVKEPVKTTPITLLLRSDPKLEPCNK